MHALLLAASLLMSPAPGPDVAPAGDLLVHAAASLADALEEIGARHEAATGVRVRLHLGGSHVLARQILEGAPGDVFLAADEARMDLVEDAGLIVGGTRRTLLENSLVVIVPAGSELRLRTESDLASDGVERIAVADPAAVPAGIHAVRHLRAMGLLDAVQRRLVPSESVRAARAAVAAGSADAGIVYATDAVAGTGVRVELRIPPDPGDPIRVPVAMLASSRRRTEAAAFLQALRSPAAGEVFARHGFVVRP